MSAAKKLLDTLKEEIKSTGHKIGRTYIQLVELFPLQPMTSKEQHKKALIVIEKIIFISSTIFSAANYWFVRYFLEGRFRHTFINYFMTIFQSSVLVMCVFDNLFFTKVLIHPQGYSILTIKPLISS